MKYELQSARFHKTKFTTQQARAYLKRKNIKPIKHVDITPYYYRYRITEPIYDRYITKKISDGIEYVYGIK